MKIDTFKVKIDIFKIKTEKCPENEKNERKHVRFLHARIGPTQINDLIMRLSRPRPAVIDFNVQFGVGFEF